MNKPTQAEKFRATMIKKHGSLEKWQAANKENSAKGGRAGGGQKGFANGNANPSEAGKKGAAKRWSKK